MTLSHIYTCLFNGPSSWIFMSQTGYYNNKNSNNFTTNKNTIGSIKQKSKQNIINNISSSFAAPQAWNSLPESTCSANSMTTSNRLLKTFTVFVYLCFQYSLAASIMTMYSTYVFFSVKSARTGNFFCNTNISTTATQVDKSLLPTLISCLVGHAADFVHNSSKHSNSPAITKSHYQVPA